MMIKGFISLQELVGTLSDHEIMEAYKDIRYEFERTHSNLVDASDAYSITVFPFSNKVDMPDNYKVQNYITGFYDGKLALQNSTNPEEVILCS